MNPNPRSVEWYEGRIAELECLVVDLYAVKVAAVEFEKSVGPNNGYPPARKKLLAIIKQTELPNPLTRDL